MTVADLVLGEAVFLEKPEMVKLEWDSPKGKNIHGIGVSWKNEKGEVVDDNPTPEFAAGLKEPLYGIGLEDPSKPREKTMCPMGRSTSPSKTVVWNTFPAGAIIAIRATAGQR